MQQRASSLQAGGTLSETHMLRKQAAPLLDLMHTTLTNLFLFEALTLHETKHNNYSQ